MAKHSAKVVRAWRKLTQAYGARLTDAYGAECPEDWVELIETHSVESIASAIIAVRREHLHHPPTYGEFEAAIPKHITGRTAARSVHSLLVAYVIAAKRPCPHQLAITWAYFGSTVEHPTPRGIVDDVDVTGVRIPPCITCAAANITALVANAERWERDQARPKSAVAAAPTSDERGVPSCAL